MGFTIIIGVVVLAAVFRSDIFWEAVTGGALLGTIVAGFELEPGPFVTGLFLFAGCCWYWARWAPR